MLSMGTLYSRSVSFSKPQITWRALQVTQADKPAMSHPPASDLRKAMGWRLRLAREARHLTQEALGELADVGATTVQGWEIGRNTIDALALARLAGPLGVSVDYLVLGDIGSLRADKAVELQALQIRYNQNPPRRRGPRPKSASDTIPLVRDLPDFTRKPGVTLHEPPATYLAGPKSHTT